MGSQLYQQATDPIKVKWLMQMLRETTRGTWVDGEKEQPDAGRVQREVVGNQI